MKVFLSSLENGSNKRVRRAATSEEKMKIFLSAVEGGCGKETVGAKFDSMPKPLLWNLMSFYYLKSDVAYAEKIRDNSRLVMVDSGAHSFQKGKHVEWEKYTREYARFIRRFDRENVIGYFEMDVDNVIGYAEVLRLREILKGECGCPDKVIPVWHKNRGVADFKNMCAEHSGHIIAIPGFRGDEIRDEQFPMFVKEAKKHSCKVHCLGMTRRDVLDKVPFDFVDSSSWAHYTIFGQLNGKRVTKEFSKTNIADLGVANYLEGMKMQIHYFEKWKQVCGDEF